MKDNVQSATTKYVLHTNPPYMATTINGCQTITWPNGATFLQLSEDMQIPTHCPAPDKLMYFNTLLFFHKNRTWLPGAILVIVLAMVVHGWLLATDGGEMYAAWVTLFSFWMNAALIVLGCLCLIAWSVSKFSGGITVEMPTFGNETKALPPGEISIFPDVAVFSDSEEETAEEYKQRVYAATQLCKGGSWLLVMPYRQSFGVVQTSSNVNGLSEGFNFLRSQKIGSDGYVITQEDTAKAANTFGRETWAQYQAYCVAFANDFIPWAITEKMRMPDNDPTETILRNMAAKSVMLLVALVFSFAGAATAQKSVQAQKYLGKYRYEKDVPSNGADVSFVFQKVVLSRKADGQKTYKEILPSGAYYSDADNAGRLIGITVNGEAIMPEQPQQSGRVKTTQATTAAAEPVSAVPVPSGYDGFFEGLPDSARAEALKSEHLRNKAIEWKKLKPFHEYCLWMFWQYMILILSIAGGLWMAAKASASDAILDMRGYPLVGNIITSMHIWSKSFLFLILIGGTLVIVTFDAIRYHYTESFSLFWLIKYGAICYVWYVVIEKIIPNTPSGGGMGANFGNYPGNSGHKMLKG